MDGLPGYDAWKLRSPEDDAARYSRRGHGKADASIGIYRYDPVSGSEVEMEFEVRGSLFDGAVDDCEIVQPIGPQFEFTEEEWEQAREILMEAWRDDEPDYPEREDY